MMGTTLFGDEGLLSGVGTQCLELDIEKSVFCSCNLAVGVQRMAFGVGSYMLVFCVWCLFNAVVCFFDGIG